MKGLPHPFSGQTCGLSPLCILSVCCVSAILLNGLLWPYHGGRGRSSGRSLCRNLCMQKPLWSRCSHAFAYHWSHLVTLGADPGVVASINSRMVAPSSLSRALTLALANGKERGSWPVPYAVGIALRSLYCSTCW